jgi:alkylhydroperoxidase/carboxymuconolactone decarboxylase family protein YurZ
MTRGKMTVLDTHDETDEADLAATPGHVSGNWNPSWEPFAKLDPAWTEKVIAMAIAPAVSGALDTKTVELVRIALDASSVHLNAQGVRRHIRRALQAGATKAEITAVLQIASLQGLESMRVGAPILLEELQAEQPTLP